METRLSQSADELEGLAHSSLDVHRLQVVPPFLQERHQEVDTHEDVLSEFFLAHGFIANSDVHADGFLELELN